MDSFIASFHLKTPTTFRSKFLEVKKTEISIQRLKALAVILCLYKR